MMNRFRQRKLEASLRMAEKRKREDAAPRLAQVVPRLQSLKLELEEQRLGATISESVHVRRVTVAHAPALFEFACLERQCVDGGHDLTETVLKALEAGQEEFSGTSHCHGKVAGSDCLRVLAYRAVATYEG